MWSKTEVGHPKKDNDTRQNPVSITKKKAPGFPQQLSTINFMPQY